MTKKNGLSSFEEGRLKESVDQLREDMKKMSFKITHLEARLNKGTGFAIGILIILSIAMSGLNSFWATWFR